MNSEEKPEKGEGREGVSAQPSQVWRLGPAEEGCQDRVHLVQDSGCPAPPQRHGSFWSDCCPVWSCMFNSLWHRHAGNSTWKAVAIWRCRVVGGLEAHLFLSPPVPGVRLHPASVLAGFECVFCNFVCKTKNMFERHLQIHLITRMFECDVCHKFMKTPEQLLEHKKCHTVPTGGLK